MPVNQIIVSPSQRRGSSTEQIDGAFYNADGTPISEALVGIYNLTLVGTGTNYSGLFNFFNGIRPDSVVLPTGSGNAVNGAVSLRHMEALNRALTPVLNFGFQLQVPLGIQITPPLQRMNVAPFTVQRFRSTLILRGIANADAIVSFRYKNRDADASPTVLVLEPNENGHYEIDIKTEFFDPDSRIEVKGRNGIEFRSSIGFPMGIDNNTLMLHVQGVLRR